jgi:hypothetical protein
MIMINPISSILDKSLGQMSQDIQNLLMNMN